MTSLEQVDSLTVKEFDWLMEAESLRKVDRDFWLHRLAFQSFRVKDRRKAGKGTKFVYNSFRKFFNYEEELKKVQDRPARKKETRLPGLYEYMRKKNG